MPTAPPAHHTPIRRLSQGSLFRLSRSDAYPDAPHGLGFLQPALSELVEEMETLLANADGLRNLEEALGRFNESFSSWLYIMNMNALTTDWPQVSQAHLFARRVRFILTSGSYGRVFHFGSTQSGCVYLISPVFLSTELSIKRERCSSSSRGASCRANTKIAAAATRPVHGRQNESHRGRVVCRSSRCDLHICCHKGSGASKKERR